MKTKTLSIALILAILAIAAPVTYVLAHRTSTRSYYGVTEDIEKFQNEEWWKEMRTYMEEHWKIHEDDEEFWREMRQHMEQHWEDIESEEWWAEMKEYMEQRWEDRDSYGRYGRYGGYGYGRGGGCHW
ncbi:MAG: hypothetical protein JSW14_06900 [Candidatus Bathyarchaeum sp.]|nr:MAG: hypothetical protein JSW14_06900 [Candidatus Bathyarchaeum sp.]